MSGGVGAVGGNISVAAISPGDNPQNTSSNSKQSHTTAREFKPHKLVAEIDLLEWLLMMKLFQVLLNAVNHQQASTQYVKSQQLTSGVNINILAEA